MADPLDFSSLSFTGNDVPDDPKPKTTNTTSKKSVGRPSTASKLAEVQSELESILKLALMPVLFRDIHIVYDQFGQPTGETISCANVYVDFDPKKATTVLTPEGKQLVEALAAIFFESEFLMKILNSGDAAGKYIKLLMALQPLGQTVFHNHIRVHRIESADGQD